MSESYHIIDFDELGHGDYRVATGKWPLRVVLNQVLCGGWVLGEGGSLQSCRTSLSAVTTSGINDNIICHVRQTEHFEAPYRVTTKRTSVIPPPPSYCSLTESQEQEHRA